MNGGLWYPLACKWARLEHHRYGDEWKNLMERAIQALKDRTECFDDYFPCWHESLKEARHVWNWLSLFQIWHNIAHQGLPSLEALSPEASRFIAFMQKAL